jgi:leucyl aminopeptidase (aminopeptidase T)
LTKEPKVYDGVKTASSTDAVGKMNIHLQKTETRSMSFTLYKYQNNSWALTASIFFHFETGKKLWKIVTRTLRVVISI